LKDLSKHYDGKRQKEIFINFLNDLPELDHGTVMCMYQEILMDLQRRETARITKKDLDVDQWLKDFNKSLTD
jgi:hypothetical protein